MVFVGTKRKIKGMNASYFEGLSITISNMIRVSISSAMNAYTSREWSWVK